MLETVKDIYTIFSASVWSLAVLIIVLFIFALSVSKRLRCIFIYGGHKMSRYNVKAKARQGWMKFEAEQCLRCGKERIIKTKAQGRKRK